MHKHPASYRDNSGFVFQQDACWYRYVSPVYNKQYNQLMNSGLYDELVKKKLLLPHTETGDASQWGFPAGMVLLPEQIACISYPYEWCFDMWKDAALLTLQINSIALGKGMLLKDATPFNVQFHQGKPVFIDTLSFEYYEEGKPWVAYRQFCECFLAPLLLMHYNHPALQKIFTVYPNGIPMNLLASLLPAKTKWNVNTQLHVHLQAKLSGKAGNTSSAQNNFSQKKLQLLLNGLQSFVQKLSPKKIKTTWDDYYTGTILGKQYLNDKTTLVQSFLNDLPFETVLDLGANDGHFSWLFDESKRVIATDSDSNCINALYKRVKEEGRTNMLPLITDLLTPSPAIGWNNEERSAMQPRLQSDLVLALALVHHLAIAGNVPLPMIAGWLQHMGTYLVIEFVPKSDEKVKLLLQNRQDIFDGYQLENFKVVFAQSFSILKEEKIPGTGRVLFLMKRL